MGAYHGLRPDDRHLDKKNNAAKNGNHYGIVVPILLVTIMLAPLGFVLYQLVRWIKTKQYFGSID